MEIGGRYIKVRNAFAHTENILCRAMQEKGKMLRSLEYLQFQQNQVIDASNLSLTLAISNKEVPS